MLLKPRFDGYRDKIRDSFARQTLMGTFGARLDGIEPGQVTISAPIIDSTKQQHGFAHAAVSFGIGDSAAGYSALTLLDETDEVLTVEMKINLLAPARGDRLRAVGRVIKSGRRLIVVAADVWAYTGSDSTHVAMLQGTMIPVPA